MLKIFGNAPPKVNNRYQNDELENVFPKKDELQNVSPFKYGVILGSYVKFPGGNPCCQYSPKILFVQMSPFVMKLILAGQSLYSKILVGKQKKTEDISQISLNFPNLFKSQIIQILAKKKRKGKHISSKGKKYGSLERTSKSDLGSKSPNNSETPQTSLCSSEQLSTQTW